MTTQLDVQAAMAPTPLAENLLKSGSVAPEKLVSYLGSLTAPQLDAPEAETEALLSSAAVHDLGWRRRIAVRGEDRFRWLSGMVTNAVESLVDRTGAYNLVLNSQGRIQGDCYVWRDGDRLEIEVTAAQQEALLAHFDRFIIMDDVELTPIRGQSAIGVSGPLADAILDRLGIEGLPALLSFVPVPLAAGDRRVQAKLVREFGTVIPHYALWVADEEVPAIWSALVAAGAMPAGSKALETLRIVEGIPAYGIDIQSRDLVQETSQSRAVSYTKGCYLGQEIVERVRSRGQVHRHLRALEVFLDGAVELAAIDLHRGGEEKPAGSLTSAAELRRNGARRIFALGMIRAEAEAGGEPLTFAGGMAKILPGHPDLSDLFSVDGRAA